MQRHYGTPMTIDLLAGGLTPSVTLTPGAATQAVTWAPGSLQQQVKGDNWPHARGLVVKGVTVFDQGSSGAVVNWDELFRVWDSYSTSTPDMGLIHDPKVFTGPVAKHVVEFRSGAGRYCDWARAQLVAADGDVTGVTLYSYLPFENANFVNPEAFWIWVGWLAKLQLVTTLAAASAIAAASTGAAIKTSMIVTAWIDAVVLPQPIRFLISQWNRYQMTAASGNNSLLMQNVGQASGLVGAVPGCRIAEILELCTPLGLGGISTGDLFTSFGSNELGQDTTTNPDNFTMAYRNSLARGTVNSNGATPGHDGAGNPNTLAATPNLALGNVAQLYMPWRFSSRNQRPENCIKWGVGNITLNRTFTVTPTSGMHTVVTNEIRELDGQKWGQLQAAAGLSGAKVQLMTDRQLRPGQQTGQAGVFVTR